MNARWLAVMALACAACFTPRSVGFGQTGALLSEGEAEIAVSPGVQYRSETSAPQDTGTSSKTTSTSAGIAFPAFEANFAYGIAEPATFNLHLSPAGIQPGLKVRVIGEGPVRVAVLPELGVGYLSAGNSTTTTAAGTSVTQSGQGQSLADVLVGFKLIASHESGVYGGVGYDFEYVSFSGLQTSLTGGTNQTNESEAATWHNLLLAVGYDVSLGGFKLRPELALLFAPASTMTVTQTSGGTTQSNSSSGGSAITAFLNLTVAAGGHRSR